MEYVKYIIDSAKKKLLGDSVPRELFELQRYFRIYQTINFKLVKEPDGIIIATSTDFHYGKIITSGKNKKDLDKNLIDAILTSFEVPAVYEPEADINVCPVGEFAYAAA